MLTILAVVFVGYFAIIIVKSLVLSLLHTVVALLVPLAIVGVVALGLYTVINRRSLGGGRRYLP